jgi:type IV pilus assembly protein PilQ
VLSLKVTPQITPDNRIILDLTVKKDSVGQILRAPRAASCRAIDTREITTQVLVNDGQTVVLGGILETERRDTEQGAVPRRRPGLGISSRPRPRRTTRTSC